mmetsp:Transcript_16464/g.51230  ORF Transcript_16464/g.51230 Transcript_16464/m.51230 type:complete len:393 (-) Transcript_16464:43-1221(-)
MVQPREKMVLDLEVEPSIEHAKPVAAHIRTRLDLPLHEGCRARQAALGAHTTHAVKVVRDEEEEGEVEGARAHRRADAQRRVHRRLQPERQRDEARPEAKLARHRWCKQGAREGRDLLALPSPREQLERVEEEQLKRVHRLAGQNVKLLERMPRHPAVRWLEPQHAVRLLVRVGVDVVGVQVVHHHVLLQPEHHVAADPVLRVPKAVVDHRVARERAVVRVVLDVETDPRKDEAEKDGEEERLAAQQHIPLNRHGGHHQRRRLEPIGGRRKAAAPLWQQGVHLRAQPEVGTVGLRRLLGGVERAHEELAHPRLGPRPPVVLHERLGRVAPAKEAHKVGAARVLVTEGLGVVDGIADDGEVGALIHRLARVRGDLRRAQLRHAALARGRRRHA